MLLFLLHFMCVALRTHARLQRAMSTESCGAGRQQTCTVQRSRKSTAGKRRSTGGGTNNCSLWAHKPPWRQCGYKTNTSTASSLKNIFYSGTFPVEAQEEPINLTKEFHCQKKINKEELGSDEVLSPPSPFYCRGD